MANSKRRRTSQDSWTDILHIGDLPDSLLADNVASYLSKPSRALFAAAMTAPPSSWRKTNWTKQPSVTSKAIILSEFSTVGQGQNIEQWHALDFLDIEKSLAKKLTDDDVGAVLACINAKQTLKTLKLTGCVNILGHCLQPLMGSICLEQIDLSLVKQNEKLDIEPEPLISTAAVVPILVNIVDTRGCALKHVQLAKKWCDHITGSVQDNDLSQFLPLKPMSGWLQTVDSIKIFATAAQNTSVLCVRGTIDTTFAVAKPVTKGIVQHVSLQLNVKVALFASVGDARKFVENVTEKSVTTVSPNVTAVAGFVAWNVFHIFGASWGMMIVAKHTVMIVLILMKKKM
ncbi:hypothetical protein ACHAXR_005422 [Thalassiosira sp. AJA248-18]